VLILANIPTLPASRRERQYRRMVFLALVTLWILLPASLVLLVTLRRNYLCSKRIEHEARQRSMASHPSALAKALRAENENSALRLSEANLVQERIAGRMDETTYRAGMSELAAARRRLPPQLAARSDT
jgi:hypothetical protein